MSDAGITLPATTSNTGPVVDAIQITTAAGTVDRQRMDLGSVGGSNLALGAAAKSAAVPVVLATDQPAIPTTASRATVQTLLNAVSANGQGATAQNTSSTVTILANGSDTAAGTVMIYGALAGGTAFVPLATLQVPAGGADAVTFPSSGFGQFYAVLSGFAGAGAITCQMAGVQ
jgi:hypothetical protein